MIGYLSCEIIEFVILVPSLGLFSFCYFLLVQLQVKVFFILYFILSYFKNIEWMNWNLVNWKKGNGCHLYLLGEGRSVFFCFFPMAWYGVYQLLQDKPHVFRSSCPIYNGFHRLFFLCLRFFCGYNLVFYFISLWVIVHFVFLVLVSFVVSDFLR